MTNTILPASILPHIGSCHFHDLPIVVDCKSTVVAGTRLLYGTYGNSVFVSLLSPMVNMGVLSGGDVDSSVGVLASSVSQFVGFPLMAVPNY